ncbi:sodium-coupled monocarboxylate transporter 1-like [Periplaneta americana]|uniref:sodium-coupled monocarboxylate transporter 1-like n=1 Tax=Periplaneta americana TaxID=6978 RepID=UPI0037E9C1C0
MNITGNGQDMLQNQQIGWLDITIFSLMMLASILIGIYYGFWGKKNDTMEEYLHGSRAMSVLPISASLIVSFISGVTILSIPAEIYLFGTLYSLYCVGQILSGFITHYIFLPVFFDLKITSTYEYLQLRFNMTVRIVTSALCTIYHILFLSIAVYIPSLAVSQVSGIGFEVIAPVISIICIVYTMLGGIKAVVYVDFLQGCVILVCSVTVLVLGLIENGGFAAVWRTAQEGGRIIFFEMNPSPFERITFWSVTIGNTFQMAVFFSINQSMVQRYVSLPTFSKARTSVVLSTIGIVILSLMGCFTGLLAYAKYKDCDPITSKAIQRPDQIVVYFVMSFASTVPGLSGLFIAGILSASLSTISSSLNSLGATIYCDFLRPLLRRNINDRTANNIMKCVVFIVGITSTLLVYVVSQLGNIIQVVSSILGITSGAVLGIFSFGVLNPRGNTKGALAGSVVSLIFMGWITIGTLTAIIEKKIKPVTLPLRVDGCPAGVNVTQTPQIVAKDDSVFPLYKISFAYYTMLGMLIMLVVGTTVSLLTEAPNKEQTNLIYFAPFVRKILNKQRANQTSKEVQRLVQGETSC